MASIDKIYFEQDAISDDLADAVAFLIFVETHATEITNLTGFNVKGCIYINDSFFNHLEHEVRAGCGSWSDYYHDELRSDTIMFTNFPVAVDMYLWDHCAVPTVYGRLRGQYDEKVYPIYLTPDKTITVPDFGKIEIDCDLLEFNDPNYFEGEDEPAYLNPLSVWFSNDKQRTVSIPDGYDWHNENKIDSYQELRELLQKVTSYANKAEIHYYYTLAKKLYRDCVMFLELVDSEWQLVKIDFD